MSKNSFKAKNGLTVVPVDPATIVNPEAGDIIADSTDSNKIKQYNPAASMFEELGGGAGGINYLTNPDAETGTTGWVTYADVAQAQPVDGVDGSPAITLTATTVSPLRGLRSFLLSKGALNEQGEGTSVPFTIDPADRASILRVSFDYSSTTNYLDGDVRVYVYDITNSRLIEVVDRDVKANAQGKYVGTFQSSPDSVSYRLILHVASTNDLAWDLEFDNVIVGPREIVRGAIVTDYETLAVTLTTDTGSVTNATTTCRARRNGDKLEGFVKISFSDTSAAFTQLYVQVPYTFDQTKQAGPNNAFEQVLGTGSIFNQDTALYPATIYSAGSNLLNVRVHQDSATGVNSVALTDTVPFTFSTGDDIAFKFEVPILGWSSNATLSEDAGNREIVSYGGVVTSQAINTTATDVTFGNVVSTTASFDGTTFTVPETGYYDISATGLLNVTAFTAITTVHYFIAINGETSFIVRTPVERTGLVSLPPIVTTVLLKKGSTVTVRARKETDDVTVQFNADDRLTRLHIAKRSSPQTIAASEVVALYATGTTGTIFDGAASTVVFPTKVLDTHGAYDSTTGIFTVPQTGIYSIHAVSGFTGSLPTSERVLITIVPSGTTVHPGGRITGAGVSNEHFPQVTAQIPLTKGETVRIQFKSGGTSNNLASSDAASRFSITKVG